MALRSRVAPKSSQPYQVIRRCRLLRVGDCCDEEATTCDWQTAYAATYCSVAMSYVLERSGLELNSILMARALMR